MRQSNLFYAQGEYGAQTYAAGPPWMAGTAGIWQDVFFQAVPPLRVEDVAIRPWVDKGLLELEITVRNHTPETQAFRIGGAIRTWINEAGKDVIAAVEPERSLGGTVLTVDASEALDDHLICGPGFSNTHKLPLSLTAGWNHVVAKVGQLDGPWTFRAQVECSDSDLLARIRASATAP